MLPFGLSAVATTAALDERMCTIAQVGRCDLQHRLNINLVEVATPLCRQQETQFDAPLSLVGLASFIQAASVDTYLVDSGKVRVREVGTNCSIGLPGVQSVRGQHLGPDGEDLR